MKSLPPRMESPTNPSETCDWLRVSNDQICQICGDDVGFTNMGERFIACHTCAFPVCRPCYEYERMDGTQACPNCRTRYKRHKGSPRVEGENPIEGEDDSESCNSNSDEDMDNEQKAHKEVSSHRHLAYEAAEECNPSIEPTQAYSQAHLLTDRKHVPGELVSEHHHHPAPMPSKISGGPGVHPRPFVNPTMPGLEESRSIDMGREFSLHDLDDVAWQNRLENWKLKPDKMQIMTREDNEEKDYSENKHQKAADIGMSNEARQPLSRKVPIPSSRINPYRMVILMRLVIVGFFFKFRLQNPVKNAYALWLTSVICEVWFAISWILDQFPKWSPINRQTYLDRLALRFEPDGQSSKLASIDIFVSTVDPMKEPPLVTANTVLSILAVDYPVHKVSCYVSDDGAAMLTFETLSEASEFARKWVPFCKKFCIEPRAPEVYFAQKIDYLKDKVQPSFVKERRIMKREYEEFKVRVNGLVAKAQKIPEAGWIMQDGTPWPGDNTHDHPGMIQVFLGHNGGHDIEGNELPLLVYVSREKRPGFNHHKKAGAMNSLVRVSGVLTNAPYILNLDCDHYINNSKCMREAMCFMMDRTIGKKCCFVQFPQRFDGIDCHDRYANHNTVFFDINLKGLDGIQGPVYVGTGCVFRRQALYGVQAPRVEKPPKATRCCCGRRKNSKYNHSGNRHPTHGDSTTRAFNVDNIAEEMEVGCYDDNKSVLLSSKSYEKRFGQSHVFVASTFYEDGGIPEPAIPASLLKEAIHVISCGYEDKTDWGKEIGWIYGSVTEDILTGFKMHCRGWRSIYCMPSHPAFKGSAPINLSDRLHQVLRWALGSVEISFSKHCPLWYGYGSRLKWLQRIAYINTAIYPLTSIPLVAYCTLPAVCLLTGQFIIPTLSSFASLWFLSLFLSIFATAILEMRWSGVRVDEWWRNEQFWVIGGVSSHLFAIFQGLLKVVAGINTSFTVTAKAADDSLGELYVFKWTTLLIPPTTLIIINLVGVVAGLSNALNSGYQSWGPLFGKLFFAVWVILHLYPFLKGLMGRQNRTPTIVIVWSVLLASIFSILWINVNPFLVRARGPNLQQCGAGC